MGRERSASDARPRIVQFRGKAPLRAWLRVIASRLAIELKGKVAREVGGLDELIAVAAAEDPELEHLRGRHLGEFRSVLNQAVSEVLGTLDVEARNLLRWHLVDNLSLRKIAVVRGEHVSAVSRQYARIRAFILDRVRQRLKEQTGLPTRDLDSVMAALRSQISLSSCAILRVHQ
jgi:RNA polymerase sigma-70 factor, ECF subfamily